jgi:hypothetical protein
MKRTRPVLINTQAVSPEFMSDLAQSLEQGRAGDSQRLRYREDGHHAC